MLERIRKDGARAGDVIGRIRALARKAPVKVDQLDINEAIREVIALRTSRTITATIPRAGGV
jgi:nitrogen fixation/metabolism regulation signal transduction histidine kinase